MTLPALTACGHLLADGTIVLTSESAGGVGASLTFLSCDLNPPALD